MKAVWGKWDPFKRINTFEVSNFNLKFVGFRIGFYV